MVDWTAYLVSLAAVAGLAVVAWLYSVVKKNVGVVDSLWSLMILASLVFYVLQAGVEGARATLVLILLSIWAVRLSVHITVRNHGEAEDRRYQAIRANNQPHFEWKSLYIVFGLQAFLAWFIAMPAVAASASATPLGWLDLVAFFLWAVGMFFEVVGDWQLARFLKNRDSKDAVMDRGLWRYSRHPNYFGEAVIWWAIFLFAVAGGGWWTVLSPVLMTFLLVRVSGVALLEKDIAERRPAYRDYVARTNSFIPAPPKRMASPGVINGA